MIDTYMNKYSIFLYLLLFSIKNLILLESFKIINIMILFS
jgi:hypothetical protein